MPDPSDPRVTSTDGHDPAAAPSPAPGPIDPATGQHESYWILTAEERAKGFVRPVRRSYKHVGVRPRHPTRPLTDEEKGLHVSEYVAFEAYPAGGTCLGRFWTAEELVSGCGSVTTMGQAIAETYARQPSFYGATFCCECHAHLPVGSRGEFVWIDEAGRETTERVGT